MTHIKRFICQWCPVVGLLAILTPSTEGALVGLWEFEDPNDLPKATVGSDLVLTGTDTAVSGSGTAFDGGAAQVGVGSHYTATHGIAPNGGGTRVNQYSLLFDISYPSSSAGSWMTFFSADTDVNANDGEYFIHPSDESWGVGDLTYTDNATTGLFFSSSDTWYRAILTFDLGNSVNLYVNGNLTGVHNVSSTDSRFSLENVLHLLGDENGDDATINVSNFAIYDSALSANQVSSLGGPGRAIVPEPCTAVMASLTSVCLVGIRRRRAPDLCSIV